MQNRKSFKMFLLSAGMRIRNNRAIAAAVTVAVLCLTSIVVLTCRETRIMEAQRRERQAVIDSLTAARDSIRSAADSLSVAADSVSVETE